jgi:hypothetical protein
MEECWNGISRSAHAVFDTRAFKGAAGVVVLVPPNLDPSPDFREARAVAAALRSAIDAACPNRVVYLSTIGAQATQPRGTLRLKVVNSCGGPVEDWWVLSFRNQNGREMKSVFRGDSARELPYGTYHIRIAGGAFVPHDGSVTVERFLTTYVIGLDFGGLDDTLPLFDIRGRFTDPPAPIAWCKLMGLYNGEPYLESVKPDGVFLFPQAPAASYLLLCQRDSGLLALRRVEMCHGAIDEIVIGEMEATLSNPK